MSKGAGGILALLDLPVGSVLNLDGEKVILKRDDFIGFCGIPAAHDDDDDQPHHSSSPAAIHLVTVRAGSHKSGAPSSSSSSATTVGFLFATTTTSSTPLIRRYDPVTEELSSQSVDDVTATNLIQQIENGNVDPQRVVPFSKFMSPNEKSERWKRLSGFVSLRLLERRGIQLGAKLIPGAYVCDDDDDDDIGSNGKEAAQDNSNNKIVDGRSVHYPPIPVLLPSKSQLHHHARTTSHAGTKQFMKKLSPAQRTSFFTTTASGRLALDHLLVTQYDNQYRLLLGDLQLSYLLFQNLHCWTSLTHWRDLVAMLSAVPVEGVRNAHEELYASLLLGENGVLLSQVATMEEEDLLTNGEEEEEENFLVAALQRLMTTASACFGNDKSASLDRFQTMLRDNFPSHFEQTEEDLEVLDVSNKMDVDDDNNNTKMKGNSFDDYEDDDDAPVVVPTEEVEASMARASEISPRRHHLPHGSAGEQYSHHIREQYPLLFAANAASASTEDILMTCARALDEATDVSLVRESAAYLEEVEAKRA